MWYHGSRRTCEVLRDHCKRVGRRGGRGSVAGGRPRANLARPRSVRVAALEDVDGGELARAREPVASSSITCRSTPGRGPNGGARRRRCRDRRSRSPRPVAQPAPYRSVASRPRPLPGSMDIRLLLDDAGGVQRPWPARLADHLARLDSTIAAPARSRVDSRARPAAGPGSCPRSRCRGRPPATPASCRRSPQATGPGAALAPCGGTRSSAPSTEPGISSTALLLTPSWTASVGRRGSERHPGRDI